jgi:hypothetical protein
VALDFNMSPRIGDALRALFSKDGFDFTHMQELVPGPSQDDFWADAFKRFGGHVVLSGDCKIAYKPHLAIAFIDNEFLSFFPGEAWSHFGGADKAALMVHAWPRIAAAIRTQQRGTCWRIPCARRGKGALRLLDDPLEPLKIPHEVLKAARAQKAS